MPTKNDQPLELRLDKKPRHPKPQKSYGLIPYDFDVPDEEPILYSAGKPYGFCGEGGERRVVRLR
ncbi:MAG: hypothetical protein Q8R53_02220 [Nanoarchaeota archaeon]|nr:hypothetical protein [Nanoarchaeota archaeon]